MKVGTSSARGLLRRKLGDLSASGVDQLRVGVSVAPEPPSTVDRFGEKHPHALRVVRVARGLDYQVGELFDDGQLLVAVECAGVGEHLDTDIAGLAVDIGKRSVREIVNECRGVLTEHRD